VPVAAGDAAAAAAAAAAAHADVKLWHHWCRVQLVDDALLHAVCCAGRVSRRINYCERPIKHCRIRRRRRHDQSSRHLPGTTNQCVENGPARKTEILGRPVRHHFMSSVPLVLLSFCAVERCLCWRMSRSYTTSPTLYHVTASWTDKIPVKCPLYVSRLMTVGTA